MANYKRKHSKISSGRRSQDRYRKQKQKLRLGLGNHVWMGRWPRWWDIVFHRRPYRAHEKMHLTRIKKDVEYYENFGFDPPKKPHKYYW